MFPKKSSKNIVENIYKKQNDIIQVNDQKIMQMEEEIQKLREINSQILYQNSNLIQENNELHEITKQLKIQNSIYYSQNMQMEENIRVLLLEKSGIENCLKKQKSQIKKLKNVNFRFKNSIEEMELEKTELLREINKLKHELDEIKKDNDDLSYINTSNNFFLDEHYRNSIINANFRAKNHYPTHIQEILTIISFVGESWYNVLQQIFSLPSFRTVQRYRHKYIEKYQISTDIFNGSLENLQKIIDIFANKNDLRYVISIDAISLKSYVGISSDGTVHGLKFIKKIPESYARICLDNEEQYELFIEKNKKQIENYVFVIYLCALDPNSNSFPMVLIPDYQGNCSNDVLNLFIETKYKLLNLGLDIIGNSFDGDLKYFDLLNEKYKKIINIKNYNLNLPFNGNLFFEQHNYMFSDPLHLLKCVRYRYVNDTPKFCFFTDEIPSITSESYLKIGIPHYLLDNHKAKKWKTIYL